MFELPFKGNNIMLLGYHVVQKYPTRISNSYSPKLANFIEKLMDKNAGTRPMVSETFGFFPDGVIASQKERRPKTSAVTMQKDVSSGRKDFGVKGGRHIGSASGTGNQFKISNANTVNFGAGQ